MQLYIAEKPSVAKAISEQLGIKTRNKNHIECQNDSTVTWCFGHMLELKSTGFYLPVFKF